MAKVSFIGAGRVGALSAYTIAERGLAKDIVLVDVNEPVACGQAEDIMHALALHRDTRVIAGKYGDVSGSDVVVVTCGLPRTAATTDRMELLNKNISIIKDVAENLKKHAKGAVILTVTNPSDIMNYFLQKAAGFAEEKVIGFGGLLDSARFRHIISEHLKCKPSELENTYVVGEHGEGMVPLFSKVKVRGKIQKFSPEEKQEITGLLKKSAWNVINMKGATEFGPASCIADIVGAVLRDTKEILPVSIVRDGASVGVLAGIGREGANPIEMKMDDGEKSAFLKAGEKLREVIVSAGGAKV